MSISPLNAAEKMVFNCTLFAPFDIVHGSNYAISVKFPKQYNTALVNPDESIYCSASILFSQCLIVGDREVQFQVFTTDVKQLQPITLVIYGVINPSEGQTDPVTLSVYDLTKKTVLSVSPNLATVGSFRIDKTPQRLIISNLTVDDPYTGSFANYNFTLNLGVSVFSKNGALYIYWPTQYANLFTATRYECVVAYGGLVSTSCVFQPETFNMRTLITLPFPAANNLQDTLQSLVVTVYLKGIPNPKVSGPLATSL